MIGTSIGPYQILAKLGEGGMGEVYRARDTNLNRDVALKILPESFAADADRIARFKREAQVLASLNHTNIAAIYGIEVRSTGSGHANALVMELVEGEDLSAVIGRGAVPADDALSIARQLIDALEAAHEQGIVHRDLKPANVKVRTDGTVKVLDFGLAKALDQTPESGLGTQDSANSPTLTVRGTQMGMIIGTAAYMAPEQARGRAVDRRADIWAFGVVLYEMLTGRRAFDGDDVSITLASVLKEDITWNALPADLPASIRRLLRRCLEKDPKRRLSAIGDARLELDEAASPPDATPGTAARSGLQRWERWIWASAAGAAAATAVFFALRPTRTDASPPIARFEVLPPGTGAFNAVAPRIAVSPDGRLLVFGATSQPGKPDQLWIRRLDSTHVTPVAGTESGADSVSPQSPFWSPDGRHLAFFVQTGMQNTGSETRLRTVDLQGGAVQTIAELPSNNGSGSWNSEGVILVSSQGTKGIQRIPAGGGPPVQVTTLDPTTKEIAHLWPQFLPDGRHFIYQSQTPSRTDWAVFVGSIDSPDRRKLVQSEYARFAPPDLLLFVKSGNLLAQRMDPGTFALNGAPILVGSDLPAMPNGRVALAVSDNGVLVYGSDPAQQGTAGDRQLTWLDRSGKPMKAIGPQTSGITLRLSPDATRVALLELGSGAAGGTATAARSLWVAELDRGVKAPLASDRVIISPTWSADGLRLRFGTREDAGRTTIAERLATGATPATAFYDEEGRATFPLDESQDGTLVFASSTAGGAVRNLYFLSPSTGKAVPYLSDGVDRPQASLSRDGKWLAYASNESGMFQIVVQPFPDASKGKWVISTNGGLAPRWRRDGRELFYVDADQRLIAVEVTTDRGFKVGKSTPLFFLPTLQRAVLATGAYTYDVSPDGQRFLVSMLTGGVGGDSRTTPLTVVTNWTALLKR